MHLNSARACLCVSVCVCESVCAHGCVCAFVCVRLYACKFANVCLNPYVLFVLVRFCPISHSRSGSMGWQRLAGKESFDNDGVFCRALLQNRLSHQSSLLIVATKYKYQQHQNLCLELSDFFLQHCHCFPSSTPLSTVFPSTILIPSPTC